MYVREDQSGKVLSFVGPLRLDLCSTYSVTVAVPFKSSLPEFRDYMRATSKNMVLGARALRTRVVSGQFLHTHLSSIGGRP